MKLEAALFCFALGCAWPTAAAAPKAAAQAKPSDDTAAYQHLIDAANAAVAVKTKALANARSVRTLGAERTGSGVLFGPEGLVLTIGYLILEAESVEVTSSKGRTVPATVVAYDPATGFRLLR